MLEEILPKGSARRTAAVSAALFVLFLVATKLLLPGSQGQGGTPWGVLFSGVVIGSINALTALGLVLIYRTTRIINFAQAALGAVGAVFTYNFVTVLGLPYGLAFLAGVIVAAAIGVVVELAFVRKFFSAPRLVLTIVTIGLASLLAGAPFAVDALPIWGEERGLAERLGGISIDPIPSFSFRVFGHPQDFGFEHLFTLVMLAAALFGLGAFLRFTRMGIAIRASSENTDRAELLGINVKSLSTIVWAIAGALSGISIILFGTVESFAIAGVAAASSALIPALAAAVLARMRSLGIAASAAVGLTALQQAVVWSYPNQQVLVDAGFFLVILIGLLAQRKELGRQQEASSWEASEELRPTPREMLAIQGVRLWRFVLIGLVAGFLLLFPFIASTGATNLAGVVAITAIVILSLVVLTGWTGQVSLGQYAFVAIGAVVGGAMTNKVGIPFWFAIPVGAIASGAVAVLVGLPALRIKGLFLAVATFAFAFVTRSVLFDEQYFGWLLPEQVERPTLFLLDFEDERSMYFLTLVVLAVCIAVVVGLRRTRPGRVLIALRENETELQSFGVNVVRTKLAAFALAGVLCGVAGVLFAHHQRAVTDTSFVAQASINVFIYAVLGGISSVSGAILGSMFLLAERVIPSDPTLSFFINPNFGLLVILWVAPGGLAAIFYGLRDGILRIVAQRRQMVVPALFEDVDPEALERQLVPLAEPAGPGGLEALDGDRRYRLRSELYGLGANGRRDGERKSEQDREVLGRVAESAGTIEE